MNDQPTSADGPGSTPERDLILGAFADAGSGSRPAGGGVGSASGSGVGSEDPTSVGLHSGSRPTPFEADRPIDTFPGYEIVREIHRGGQGVVYQATQASTKQKVAIKVMHGGATLGSSGRARFEREVQVLGQLNHPNIVKLHDSGVTADGSFFYVMDYIAGRALDDVLREQRAQQREAERELAKSGKRSRSGVQVGPTVDDTLKLFAKICEAMNAAHLRGVIHRDLKPANIRVDHNGEPIVVDFGLAKTLATGEGEHGDGMTMTGQFVGSLPWASPEQASGTEGIDLRTDVYSLGIVLYQMLTVGKFPYEVVGNMRDVLDNIQRAEPTRPSTVRRQINDEVETIVLKALSKDRERRYQSAGELARDIERYLAGEAIEAKRDSGWYLVQKTVKRHKAPAAFAASVAVLLVVFGGVMTGAYQKTEAALVSESAERERAEDNLWAVLDLAGTLVHDFHDSIAHLRGATEARELVLASALEQLERVQSQAIDDERFLLQLAEAHERVGDLYGGLLEASTGTTAQAQHHYSESLRIRSAIYDAAVASGQGVAVMSELMGRSRVRLADTDRKQGRLDNALEGYTKAAQLAAAGGDEDARLIALTKHTDVLREQARQGESLPEIEAGLDAVESAYSELHEQWEALPGEKAERWAIVLEGKLAAVAMIRGEARLNESDAAAADPERGTAGAAFRVAIERSATAQEAFRRRSANEPENYELARDLWVATHDAGTSVWGASQRAATKGEEALATELLGEARGLFVDCVALAEAMAADESNLEAQRDLATALNKLGNVMRDAGEFEEARRVFARGEEIRRAYHRSDPVMRHLRDRAVGEYKLAELDAMRADKAATEGERRALLELSENGYRRALATFLEFEERAGRNSSQSDQVAAELEDVLTRLAG